MPSEAAARRPRGLSRLIVAEPHEVPAVLGGHVLFFLLFSSYFMLRPVRETFGIAGGVDNLQWLYLGTFLATLVVIPAYGTLAKTVERRHLLPITYVFSAVVMAGFGFSLMTDPDNVWIARAFYIWLSVFNLFVISIAWSLMADVFNADQGHRLFGQIAAGASLGGLTGPLLSGLLVEPLGHAGLLLLSTGLLLCTLAAARYLLVWRRRYGRPEDADDPPEARIGGSIWAGLLLILRSPYLLGIAALHDLDQDPAHVLRAKGMDEEDGRLRAPRCAARPEHSRTLGFQLGLGGMDFRALRSRRDAARRPGSSRGT
jgi:ATP:ADP antiporter, AAA family